MKNIVTATLTTTAVLAALFSFASCSSVSEQQAAPIAAPAAKSKAKPASAPAASPAETQMEGGIVGTGNEDDCKDSNNKNCNDNVK